MRHYVNHPDCRCAPGRGPRGQRAGEVRSRGRRRGPPRTQKRSVAEEVARLAAAPRDSLAVQGCARRCRVVRFVSAGRFGRLSGKCRLNNLQRIGTMSARYRNNERTKARPVVRPRSCSTVIGVALIATLYTPALAQSPNCLTPRYVDPSKFGVNADAILIYPLMSQTGQSGRIVVQTQKKLEDFAGRVHQAISRTIPGSSCQFSANVYGTQATRTSAAQTASVVVETKIDYEIRQCTTWYNPCPTLDNPFKTCGNEVSNTVRKGTFQPSYTFSASFFGNSIKFTDRFDGDLAELARIRSSAARYGQVLGGISAAMSLPFLGLAGVILGAQAGQNIALREVDVPIANYLTQLRLIDAATPPIPDQPILDQGGNAVVPEILQTLFGGLRPFRLMIEPNNANYRLLPQVPRLSVDTLIIEMASNQSVPPGTLCSALMFYPVGGPPAPSQNRSGCSADQPQLCGR